MAKKRKAAKKPAAKKSARKSKKVVKATTKRVVRKSTPAKRKPKKVVRMPAATDGVNVKADASLQGRLRAVADNMAKPLDEVLTQALTEFADNWEDHFRTVNALNSEDDRMQLVVKPEEP